MNNCYDSAEKLIAELKTTGTILYVRDAIELLYFLFEQSNQIDFMMLDKKDQREIENLEKQVFKIVQEFYKGRN